jgi:glycosyltransferase involved in cell wall biosynthesis
MNIGFDAKRAFHNNTGLGNYSRTLINGLAEYYPEHQYFLFNPKPSNIFPINNYNIHECLPSGYLSKVLKSAWRSNWIKRDLLKEKINLYHGLSYELPYDIDKLNISSVVTIHDLIYERFPEQYSTVDVKIYRAKSMYACQHADSVIAISEQTKQDLVDIYKVPENKISVCYQSCNPSFAETISKEYKEEVREVFKLPPEFFVYVGSVIERKNLLNIVKAMALLNNELQIPLVVIGGGKQYKQRVKNFIHDNNLNDRVIWFSENDKKISTEEYTKTIASIYQMSVALIYPSLFEGFGIPVLEALYSRTPVITSNTSCLPETGGDAAIYVNPASEEEIAAAMLKVYKNKVFTEEMTNKGWKHAQNFTVEKCSASVMNVYKQLM